MNLRRTGSLLLVAAAAFAIQSSAFADVKPAALFGDHMVLQQGKPIPVWGWADPGEAVTVTLGDAKETATPGADGKWMVKLPEQKLGDPMTMTIAGKNTVTIKDILIGEVWVCSGQSNMAFTVSKAHASYAGLINEEEEIKAANYPTIRMFTPKSKKSYAPEKDLSGNWAICSPETVGDFSAVGYLFARDLQRELKVPVGIVTLAFGASVAEAWISREALEADPKLKPAVDTLDACEKYFAAKPQGPADQAPQRPTPINKKRAPVTRLSDPVQDQHFATVLYNGMIAPAIPFAMRGAIWYQGESIVGGDAGLSLYPHIMETLVADWRKRWDEGDFPFIAVQLPPLQNISNNPRVREGQAKILSLPNAWMAVTLDIGEPTNVHPHNKAPLGERLTKIALEKAYGKKIESSGPIYDSMKADGGAIRVKFTHAEGLAGKDGAALKWFQVAGEDKKFVDADAKVDGDSIVVSSPAVKAPVAVRYAWDNYPDGANLVNGAGLPAAPFRTDDWAYPIEGIVE